MIVTTGAAATKETMTKIYSTTQGSIALLDVTMLDSGSGFQPHTVPPLFGDLVALVKQQGKRTA